MNRPAAASTMPPTAMYRTSKRLMSCWASPAPRPMPTVTGRNASPASIGL